MLFAQFVRVTSCGLGSVELEWVVNLLQYESETEVIHTVFPQIH